MVGAYSEVQKPRAEGVGEFPSEWTNAQVSDFKPYVTSGSRGWAKYYSEEGGLFLRITNLDRGTIYLDLGNQKHVAISEDEGEALRTKVSDGDILISITADIGIIGFIEGQVPSPSFINQHLALVRFEDEEIYPKFISYYWAAEPAQRRFRAITDAGAKAGINLETVQSLTFPLPSFAEQEVIAGALADADEALRALDLLVKKKRDIKQATLQALLTPTRRLPGFDGEWEIYALRDLTHKITDGTHYTPTYTSDGVPFYSVENVTNNEFKNTKYISKTAHQLLTKRCKPEWGDVLLTRIGSIGDTKLIDWDVDASIYVSLALLKFNKKMSGAFFTAYSQSIQFRKAIEDRSLLDAIPRKINMNQIGEVQLPVPELDEQDALSQIFLDLEDEIDRLEARLEKLQSIKQGMMQVLLTGKVRLI